MLLVNLTIYNERRGRIHWFVTIADFPPMDYQYNGNWKKVFLQELDCSAIEDNPRMMTFSMRYFLWEQLFPQREPAPEQPSLAELYTFPLVFKCPIADDLNSREQK